MFGPRTIARSVLAATIALCACAGNSDRAATDADVATNGATDVGRAPIDRTAPPRDAGPAPDLPPAQPAPASFGPGFVDLTASLDGMPSAFLRVPQREGKDPEPTAGAFGDIDNDGSPELIFSASNDNAGRSGAVYTYDRSANRLTLRGPLRAGNVTDNLAIVAVLDLDGDGTNDLLFSRPGREIAWGVGGGRFDDPTPLGVAPSQWQPNYQSAVLDDFDDDGWLDVALGIPACCTTCREMTLYLRTGPRSFTDRTALLDDSPPGTAYALLAGRINGEHVIMTIGQPCGGQESPAFYRMRGRDPTGLPRFEPFDIIPPDAYIRRIEPGMNATVSISRWVPMGVALGDADSDGRSDVAISLNFYPGVFVNRGGFPFHDLTAQFGSAPLRAESGARMIPWGIALVDLDQDRRPDLITVHGNDHSAYTDPQYFVGPQYTSMHWNAGGGHFVDVSRSVAIDRRGQWRSLALDDLDGDGDGDLIVGAHNDNPRVFRNDIARGNHGFALRLRGTTSNSLGVGAEVDVTATEGEAPQRFPVGALGSPLVFSEPTVFVGLGAARVASRVRITWPSGVVQELRDLAAGTLHTVTEPALLALSPASRHAPADGRSTVTLRVTPRDLAGAVRADARVEVIRAYGSGSVSKVRRVDNAWEVTVTAPTSPGSAVLEVRVDGAASGVRPRIWWDG